MEESDQPQIISRAEAKARGLKFYFTGKPCNLGGIAERLVSSPGCLCPAHLEKNAARFKANYEANKEAHLARKKEYQQANKEACAARRKAHYEANKEAYAARSKAYYEANKEKNHERYKAYIEAYRAANKEAINEKDRKYREVNRDRRAKEGREYRDVMPDWYIADVLGLPKSQIPPELISLKRQQLEIARAQKQLKQVLKEISK